MMDFTRAFAKKKVSRLSFSTRDNVNYFHDIVFLSSYTHDALVNTADIRLIKGVLTMPMDRVGWEYYTRLNRAPRGTPGCRSLLAVSGVRSLHWSRRRLPPRLQIASVFVGERQYLKGTAHLTIYLREQRTTLELLGGHDLFAITLKDLEKPDFGTDEGV